MTTTKLFILILVAIGFLGTNCVPDTPTTLSPESRTRIFNNHVEVFNTEINSNDIRLKSVNGAGVILSHRDKKTYVLTAFHVVNLNNPNVMHSKEEHTHLIEVQAKLHGKKYPAKIESFTKRHDIAVISTRTINKQATKISYNLIKRGEKVIIFGSPAGVFCKTYIRRIKKVSKRPCPKISYQHKMILLDKYTLHGFSGGGTYNLNGELVAICTHMERATYRGICVPIPEIREFLEPYLK